MGLRQVKGPRGRSGLILSLVGDAEVGVSSTGACPIRMTAFQQFLMTVLPRRWAEDLRAESESWKIRCLGCGASKSVWEVGGVRWKAKSRGKRTLVRCSHCGGLRMAAVERVEDGPRTQGGG